MPIQDTARLSADPSVQVIQGIEARVIMLGFPREAEALKYSAETTDANPFADARVRRAVAHAVNVPAILQTIMRGSAAPASQLVSPAMRGFSNARVDELLPMIQSEIDEAKRQAMLHETTQILQDEVAYVPMYVQPLVWGAGANIALTQRPDNFFILRWVTVN